MPADPPPSGKSAPARKNNGIIRKFITIWNPCMVRMRAATATRVHSAAKANRKIIGISSTTPRNVNFHTDERGEDEDDNSLEHRLVAPPSVLPIATADDDRSDEHLFQEPELTIPDDRHRAEDRCEQDGHPDDAGKITARTAVRTRATETACAASQRRAQSAPEDNRTAPLRKRCNHPHAVTQYG